MSGAAEGAIAAIAVSHAALVNALGLVTATTGHRRPRGSEVVVAWGRDDLTLTGHDPSAPTQIRIRPTRVHGECWTAVKHNELMSALRGPVKGLSKARRLNMTVRLALSRTGDLTVEANELVTRVTSLHSDNAVPLMTAPRRILARLDRDRLAELISYVSVAASTISTLPALTGIQLTVRGDQLRMRCCDRFRVTQGVMDLSAPHTAQFTAVIPATFLHTAIRHFPTGEVLLLADNDPAQRVGLATAPGIQAPFIEVATDVLAATFPELTSIRAAADLDVVALTIDRRAAQRILRTVTAAHSGSEGARVRLTAQPLLNGVRVASECSAEGVIPARFIDREPFPSITVFARYLGDALSMASSDSVTMSIRRQPGGLRPIVFSDPSDNSWWHLVMPVRDG